MPMHATRKHGKFASDDSELVKLIFVKYFFKWLLIHIKETRQSACLPETPCHVPL